MNILLAVDGSAYTKKMLAYLSTHEDLLGNSHAYTLLTVQPPLPARARAALGKEVVDAYYEEEAEAILAPVCKFLARHGIEAKRCVKVGAIGETIAKVADTGRFDLLVMGSHGHGALATLVLGAVTTRVLAHSKIPVLLVR
ncbi:universal stress protein [Verminephrobacter aporrectodeae]|uniref:Universal stress protein n=1 Tax=Verminephrobacter aporrectodeae subsp. tuberculatae TaxID=1110392 RepID=A0ABT3KN24_9BURK|nr:universal stress protein [Verminephrobacter aporrectodeae]MCW5221108.1 universal stress protein [Verminephrobacter aporrectodeae subsp. tuberculatae]MCW5254863.1 universal stress protein [Verminephrobacter aporrectodeae subsp. tuberculatae]MCW5290401.1 universal stress protein [Verminephrobacter aporrectodeae subsp. tuberculatae]MCW5319704.1 universal stress protein [Verminephrobacter aporrectodeae subsp. tuberculatae]MCW8164953.1 universal stress protein [Verminephrobacter aporrectodeae su